ncbi:MAG: hypothetical protein GY903_30285 [Fuerstiella sp.]|nr:hypothetical protein [Fuerstiella sp.]MCP4858783.1 hypothetical protein [Fuerstiella sp.]
MSRRAWLAGAAATTACSSLARQTVAATPQPVKPKSVAAVLTAYEHGLHADVLIGKILEGWKQDGGAGPALELAAMYVEQFTDRDMARSMSQKHGVPIFETIEQAVTVGGEHIPVDGVISVGEHGNYPSNNKGQTLYPRRRFFEAITDAFRKYDKVVPVFSDKHLGPVWSDAKWMYDRAIAMKVPFMAGSSMTVGYREPHIEIRPDCEVEAAVGIGYSGLDIYGSHALEFFQCHVERRQGAEVGVKWVQCLHGDAMWKVLDEGVVRQDMFDAALAQVPHESGDVRHSNESTLFLFRYTDGLMGAVFMLPDFARGTSVALKLKEKNEIQGTRFDERTEPRHPHFAWLLKGIEKMIHTDRATYPVERTLLTSGILDRALTSRATGQRKLLTPELEIQYHPVDYPHAPDPDLNSRPDQGVNSVRR